MVKRHSMENPTEVDLHDGEDGGIVMDIHHRRRSRGIANNNINLFFGILELILLSFIRLELFLLTLILIFH